jgi:hypothetical protein
MPSSSVHEEFDPAIEHTDDHGDQGRLPEVDVKEIEILIPVTTEKF